MSISIFSFLSALLWCNLFIIIIALLQSHKSFLRYFSIGPLFFFAAICVLRLLGIFEVPHAIIIPSTKLLPTIINFLRNPISPEALWSLRPVDLLILLWIAGSLYFAIKLMATLSLQQRFFRAGKELHDSNLQSIVEEVTGFSTKTKSVRVFQIPGISTPLVAGYFRPAIYLPDFPLTESQLRDILTHEWTHFVHKDAWIKLLVSILQALFWWNPLIHVFKKRLDHILEIRCDFKVTKKMNRQERSAYLQTILYILNQPAPENKQTVYGLPSVSYLVSVRRKSKLLQRFELVIDHPVEKRKGGVILVYIAILMVYLASYSVIWQSHVENPADWGYEKCFSISPERSYLQRNEDGTYAIYTDGIYCGYLNASEMEKEPFASLEIK